MLSVVILLSLGVSASRTVCAPDKELNKDYYYKYEENAEGARGPERHIAPVRPAVSLCPHRHVHLLLLVP